MSYLLQEKTSPAIVVDANLGAGAVLSIRGLEKAPDLFYRWGKEKRVLLAPEWWWAEVVSVVSQHVFQNLISLDHAHEVLDNVKSLEVETIPMNHELMHSALNWANRIGHSKVYDSIYLALAEQMGIEFWTADRKLVNSVRSLKLTWVKWIGDSE
jgi:predicted nucleic acid-binding protein